MRQRTRDVWAEQDRHTGDRWRLFRAVGDAIDGTTVLYPGSFVDVAPSFVFPSVTYVDVDRRAATFFADRTGVDEIITAHEGAPAERDLTFIYGDYTQDLGLPEKGFDLLISLYAGFVSEHCLDNLKVGGSLLVNPSHGDAALASIDRRLRLVGVVHSVSNGYRFGSKDLDTYLIPKAAVVVTPDLIHERRRGIGYTRPAFAYVFERVV